MTKRIITRPDFDGVVCAVLLKEALGNEIPVLWAQPNDMQTGRIEVYEGDIIANLPIHGTCALWFDHHVSNETQRPFKGIYRIAPSAAGLVYEYFGDKLTPRYDALVAQTDKIDDARLTLDEIRHPERYPYILISMTISVDLASGRQYCDHLVDLLRTTAISTIMADPIVKKLCERTVNENKTYEKLLKRHTRVQAGVSITDLRGLDHVPNGNRFLVYSLFPEAVVNLKIFTEKDHTTVKIGHSIINRNCRVNVGRLLTKYGGGGHKGAGACRLEPSTADDRLNEILDVLIENGPIDLKRD